VCELEFVALGPGPERVRAGRVIDPDGEMGFELAFEVQYAGTQEGSCLLRYGRTRTRDRFGYFVRSARGIGRCEQLPDGLRRADGHDLEVGEVPPFQDPALEQERVVALHHLEAAVEVDLDPAIDITEAVGERAAFVLKAGIDGRRVAVLESLDDHEVHVVVSSADADHSRYVGIAHSLEPLISHRLGCG
jgi:hypothetical protein